MKGQMAVNAPPWAGRWIPVPVAAGLGQARVPVSFATLLDPGPAPRLNGSGLSVTVPALGQHRSDAGLGSAASAAFSRAL